MIGARLRINVSVARAWSYIETVAPDRIFWLNPNVLNVPKLLYWLKFRISRAPWTSVDHTAQFHSWGRIWRPPVTRPSELSTYTPRGAEIDIVGRSWSISSP